MAIHSTNEATDAASPAQTTTMTSINSISSQEILDKYDTFLLDMWGVLHDGSKPYEGVLQTVKELQGMGKNLIILSNSSKRRENSHKMLGKREFQLLFICVCDHYVIAHIVALTLFVYGSKFMY